MRKYIQLVLASVVVLLGACGEEKIVVPKGTLQVFVRLLDEMGHELPDKSNVTVKLDENHVATTDAGGKAEFKDLDIGTYVVQAEKDGFDIFKAYNVRFAAGNVPGVVDDIILIQYPNVEIKTVNVEPWSTKYVVVSGTTSETEYAYFSYYLGANETVSNLSYDYTTNYFICCGQLGSFTQALNLNGFASGQKVFLAIYARSYVNRERQYGYYDHDSGKSVPLGEKRLTIAPVSITVP